MLPKIKKRVGEEMEKRLKEVGGRVPDHVKKNRTTHTEPEEDKHPARSASERGDGAPSSQQ